MVKVGRHFTQACFYSGWGWKKYYEPFTASRMRVRLVGASRVLPSESWLHSWYYSSYMPTHLPSHPELVQFPEMALLAAIVESSDDAIISKNLNGVIQSWNSAAERIYGYTKAEAVGQPITMLIPEDRLPEETHILEKIRHGERVDHFETIRMHKDGSLVQVSLTVSPIKDASGQIIGASKSARDITERKRIEEDLKSLTHELDSRVSQRTRSLTVSQDRLRALATQLSLAEERVRRSLASELHDYLGQMLVVCRLKLTQAGQWTNEEREQQLRDADRILQDAITYTRSLVAQLTPPVLREFGLIMGLTWLGEQMKQHHGLRVGMTLNVTSVNLSEEHAILLFQSVRELLMNTVQHADTTEAALTLDLTQQTLVVTVKDTGRGFDLSAEPSSTEPHFGLFSIRERMEAVGGEFVLTSRPGQGTTATLSLAVKTAPATTPSPSSPNTAPPLPSNQAQAQPVRVLMADDHPMVRQGLCAIVEQFDGIQVVGEAADGEEALRLAQSLLPDVVIMDVNMPKIDGVEATRQITATCPNVVVIGLSVHNSLQVMTAMKEAGAAAYLTKDAAPEQLCQAILTAHSHRRTAS
jgi:PAS domain S-box-containing protein